MEGVIKLLVLIAYDISAKGAEGRRRLAKVSKICSRWGSQVQRSVYECEVNAEECRRLRAELSAVICVATDNVRLYRLGNRFRNKIDLLGCAEKSWNRNNYVL